MLLQGETAYFITKWDSLIYYKVRQLVITKCDSYFITKYDKCYYKVRQVLQSAMVITKCDRTRFLRLTLVFSFSFWLYDIVLGVSCVHEMDTKINAKQLSGFLMMKMK